MRPQARSLLTGLLAPLLPLATLRAQSSAAGAIHGRVVRAGSSAAIASATIDVANVATGTPAGRVVTTADGTFTVGALSNSQFRVTVRALGLAARTLPLVTLA